MIIQTFVDTKESFMSNEHIPCKIASTALAVTKFFVVVIPRIGRSSLDGTGSLRGPSYLNSPLPPSVDFVCFVVLGRPYSGFGGPNSAPSFFTICPAP